MNRQPARPVPAVAASGRLFLAALLAVATIPATVFLHEVGHIVGLVLTGYHGPAVLGLVDGDPAHLEAVRMPVALYWAAGPLTSAAWGALALLICGRRGAADHLAFFGVLWGSGVASASVRVLFFPILMWQHRAGGADESNLATTAGVATAAIGLPIFVVSAVITVALYRRLKLRGAAWRLLFWALPLWYFVGTAVYEQFARGILQDQLHLLLHFWL